jgi:hypothetical protein
MTYYPQQYLPPAVRPAVRDPDARPGWALAASIVALAGAGVFLFASLPIYLLELFTAGYTNQYDAQRSTFIWMLSLATANVLVATLAIVGGVLLLLRVRLAPWLLMAAVVLAIAIVVAWTTWHSRTFIVFVVPATSLALAASFSWQTSVTRWLAGRASSFRPD